MQFTPEEVGSPAIGRVQRAPLPHETGEALRSGHGRRPGAKSAPRCALSSRRRVVFASVPHQRRTSRGPLPRLFVLVRAVG